jgi:glutamate-5-semialdehyde dehydrogenase
MPSITSQDIQNSLKKTKQASRLLVNLSESKINQTLQLLATKILQNEDKILKANQLDLAKNDPTDVKYQRLLLNSKKIKDIASSILEVSKLPSPLNKILYQKKLANGLELKKITVPIGVLGIIYEARPNVTPDIFSLAFKAGNAVVLKGGSDSYNSHKIFFDLIQEVLIQQKINPEIVYLMPPEREFVKDLFTAHNLVDVVIPRGSKSLIDFTRANCQIPVIETGAGVCHIFLEQSSDLEIAKKVIKNSKTSRPFACNSLDCLLVQEERLVDLFEIVKDLAKDGVVIHTDIESYLVLENKYPEKLLKKSGDKMLGKEFLGLEMNIKTVSGFDQALDIIQTYSSGHSECILTQNQSLAQEFQKKVDAAAVYVNTSTAFTDGGQFGLGCEIGISTQKLHARGPMGLEEICSYKWLINSAGAIR